MVQTMRYIILAIIMVTFSACSCKLEREKVEKEIKPLAAILFKHVGKNYLKREDVVETMDTLKQYLPMKLTPCTDEIEECVRLDRSNSTKMYYYKKGRDIFAITVDIGGREIMEDDLMHYTNQLILVHHYTYTSCRLDKKSEKPFSSLTRGCEAWFKQ